MKMRPDRGRAVAAVRELLVAVGADADRLGLVRTPDRVADLFLDYFSCIDQDLEHSLGDPVALAADEQTGTLISLTGIPFRSMCEHHLLPFEGTVDIEYSPNQCIAGLSRLASLVRTAAHRPQLQERMGQQIADTILAALRPHRVAVRIEAVHGCVAHNEPTANTARAVTIAAHGAVSGVAGSATPIV
jgi:GTP cyclohydrolase I